MLNVSIINNDKTQPYELTEDEAKAIALVRKFNKPHEMKLIIEMLEHLYAARGVK